MLIRRLRRPHSTVRGCRISSASNSDSAGAFSANGTQLPDPPYYLPHSPRFSAERCGTFNKKWLLNLPALKPLVRNSTYLPKKEELWRAPTHEALETIIGHLPYHDALRYITEHSLFLLFPTVLRARDAPLPHVIYEDFMKSCTFASLQNPPEEQFALPSVLLRTLLCMAAYHCTLDADYFTTCQMLFGRMEQQQQTTPEVLSAWVYCCTASGRVDEALTYAKYMADCSAPFDVTVFSLMQHPSLNPIEVEDGSVPHSAKGLLLQRRLGNRLHTAYRSDAVAAHGMFVYYALTLSHVRKWEVIRAAAALGVTLAERTLVLAVEVFAREKGMRCGPKTVKALTHFLAQDGTVGHLLYVLLRARKNELLPEFRDLPHTTFSEEEQELVLQCVAQRTRHDDSFAVAATLVSSLVREDDPSELLMAFARAARNHHSADVCGGDDDGSACADVPAPVPESPPSNSSEIIEKDRWAVVQASVRSLLLDVNALDQASRRDAYHKHWKNGNKGVKNKENVLAKTLTLPHDSMHTATIQRKEKELWELMRSDTPVGVRELAQLNIMEELQEAKRLERAEMAWVNPDGTF
ncbi:hypothetical protein, conserved [Trypanosoma brucei gambiense DAL972]|uniref:Uncharacterized protein n=1 Tax=Trypanosoma brucei gambiense (strain MHOM/CI/86/DAL972) TaxID=679716 RepID=C9ZQ69_TRYB9|nr:hypothetical protein, conserved [Trypanosoma brucei gambiense DAL972]CBH11549.1 hypothetical protein, conserved [Trypanosoma brucei gambiense DAL972]|eukprot:XP_011773834.1 hypothetical protein, conserved [Trypanosoma brucei gambiense DAL972]